MKTLHYCFISLITCPLMLQAIWAGGEPGGKVRIDPQSLPVCSIGEEDPEDENSNKYAIFEPNKIKEFAAAGEFTAVVAEEPQPHAGFQLDEKKKYKWTVTEGLQIQNEDGDTCTVKSSDKKHWGKQITVKCKVSFYESKNGQQKHLMDIEGEHKLLTPLVLIRQISFNHIQGKHDADAMDLKEKYDTAVISSPEAIFDDAGNATKSNPFLYLGGKKPNLKIQAEVKPGIIEKSKIKTESEVLVSGNILPELAEQVFDNNTEFEIPFQDNIESKLKKGNQKWTWKLTEIQGTGLSKQTIACETTVKNGYVLFKEPLKSPWDMNDNKKKPWIKALDVAIGDSGNIGFDQNSSVSIIENITNYTFRKMGWTYDTVSGVPKYALTSSFGTIDLDSYLEKNNGNVVNCYDQCFSLAALVRLIGINVEGNYQEPFGKILIVNLIGVGSCNNPFYKNPRLPAFLAAPVILKTDPYYQFRTGFGNHAYVTFDGSFFGSSFKFIYDACAGPVIGESSDSYQKNTIENPPSTLNNKTFKTEFP